MITYAHTDPSNYGGLRTTKPELLILHGTGLPKGATADGEVAYLQQPDLKVSYHYYVSKDGRIWELVPPEYVAWHAGVSEWSEIAARARGVLWPPQETGMWEGLSAHSIGIGLESHNAPHEPYSDAQLRACKWLCQGLMGRFGIPPYRVLTHRDVSAPRKMDPVNWPHLWFTAQLEYKHVILFENGEPSRNIVVSGDAASVKP
jgi:N-acetylmuramoyl-L-alanine amidase